MSVAQIEKLSKSSAKKVINGTDALRNTGWGTKAYWKSKSGKWYYFKSMIEANVLKTLDGDSHIVDFDTEKFLIPYNFKGCILNYVPDFILRTAAGNVFVVEVKPASQLLEEKNLSKWATAKVWCFTRGVRFFVITDKDWPKLIDIIKAFEAEDISGVQQLMEWSLN
jgi:hypothetical protein